MDPFAQAHLSELLAAARIGSPSSARDADEYKSRTLITFNAALAASKGVGAITDEQMAHWTNRMLVALGERPLQPLPPGSARLINFGGGRTHGPQRPPDPPPVSRFLGLVAVNQPDRPLDYGGRIQIVGERGREIASQALSLLIDWGFSIGIERVFLVIHLENKASNRLAARLGFMREGVLLSYEPIKGDRPDLVSWSLLPSDPRPWR